MKQGLLALLLLVMLPAGLWAQGRIVGRVTEGSKGLEYVNVGVVNLDKPVGTFTDKKGCYDLVVPEGDSLLLRFSMTGYKTQEFWIKVLHGMTLTMDCQLKAGTMLKEVEVKDDKVRRTTFTQIEVEKLDNTVGPSGGVESLLKTLPDVASNNELSSQYNVRGGSFDENLVYINGVEVYRPMLIRSGEQEGMSIINPDMVDHILFSPGGFDATYGDKMSSALDITYGRPIEFKAKASASLLGGALSAEGTAGERVAYSLGFRKHTNGYLFKSLETKGDYTTDYTDLQGLIAIKASDKLDVNVLGVWTNNKYGVVPSDRSTDFGNMMEQMHLDIYFDGQEVDSYNTMLGAVFLDYRPNDDWQLKWLNSVQSNREQETYDLQSQYWLRQAQVGSLTDTMFDRGVGTFLEHARNHIDTRIVSSELKATRYAALGNWNMGIRYQHEEVDASMREWKYVDSAGYAVPTAPSDWGNPSSMPTNPMLQRFCNAQNSVSTNRLTGYLQRDFNFNTRHNADWGFVMGVRGQYYHMAFPGADADANEGVLLSPRVSANFKPNWKKDMLFRLAAGLYHQAPFYREFRYADGTLNTHIDAQHSYQTTGTMDWNLNLWQKPFRLTADVYYKYVTNLIPYSVDNLRICYEAENNAVGYATGVSLRLNGELVEGLESWASLSVMQAKENIDNGGWISRPTDQLMSFKVFMQDNVPQFPFWRMALSFIASTGTPVMMPNQSDLSKQTRLKNYFRVDWGNTIQLSKFKKLENKKLFRYVDEVLLGVEVFNLFDYRNVVSYLWVSDVEGKYYGVPNYLTGRQVNVKLTMEF